MNKQTFTQGVTRSTRVGLAVAAVAGMSLIGLAGIEGLAGAASRGGGWPMRF
jgi:hypothetical protein